MKLTYCDMTYLQSFTGGDKERIKKYINIFLSSAPKSIDQINSRFTASDWEGIRAAAHALKPQITFMGIKNLESVIRNLEEYSSAKMNLERIPGLIDELNNVGTKAFDELKQTVTEI